ncbi:MAG: ComF family protein [Elusimicrobia bacterium]|nr:ComF family protein [Elusimicrobiota bacterium]
MVRLLDFLAPRTCGACREDLPPLVQGPLCGSCLAALAPLAGRLCERCSAPHRGRERLCGRCRGALFAVDAIRAGFAYRSPVRELLHAFKYRGRLDAGRALADWLGGQYRRHPELRGARAVAPVPLHPRRLRERGFNQAEVLAAAVARAAGLPLARGLIRRRATAPQWGLTRARRSMNVRDAFAWEGPPPPDSVLLVDDVCTSGGTLEACGLALQAAGAREIRAFVLARD